LPVDSDTSRVIREVTVAAGRFAPGHLGELTRIVPFEMVDAVLDETARMQRRVRDLPSRVVVYLLLAGALYADMGYGQVGADDRRARRAVPCQNLDARPTTCRFALRQARR